jgi:hypothetical protein
MHRERRLIDDATAPPPNMGVFGDIPRPIWAAFLCAWAMLFGLFMIFFATNGRAALAVLTASFFALMTLGLPAVLGSQSKSTVRQRQRIIETRTGPITIGAAATPILLIPAGAVLGLTVFIIFAV